VTALDLHCCMPQVNQHYDINTRIERNIDTIADKLNMVHLIDRGGPHPAYKGDMNRTDDVYQKALRIYQLQHATQRNGTSDRARRDTYDKIIEHLKPITDVSWDLLTDVFLLSLQSLAQEFASTLNP
jgi:hypothetical protein